jgi:DNA-binding IclR family transcriptional regulator
MNDDLSRGVAAIDKGLGLFISLVEDGGQTGLSTLAVRAGLPISTAQRMVAAFVRRGLLSRIGRGRYAGGVRLAGLARLGDVDPRGRLIAASRPPLQTLAKALGTTVHLGVLEGDMVTYLVKAHGGGPDLLTSEMSQLEAYCSGIGKVLLAHLPDAAQQAYLAGGPFVALTPNTLTDPLALARTFQEIAARGYAFDHAELQDNLYCIAVPVRGYDGRVVAALSASSRADLSGDPGRLDRLCACADQIRARLRRDTGEGV